MYPSLRILWGFCLQMRGLAGQRKAIAQHKGRLIYGVLCLLYEPRFGYWMRNGHTLAGSLKINRSILFLIFIGCQTLSPYKTAFPSCFASDFLWLQNPDMITWLQKVRRRRTAAWVREKILQLGPTFIKLGQLSSTRSDLFPAEFVEELSKLQVLIPLMLMCCWWAWWICWFGILFHAPFAQKRMHNKECLQCGGNWRCKAFMHLSF